VIDPFCGSGTTIVSALKNNCNGIGIDLNSEYIAIAEERVKNSGENQ
jgi:site-specific DNA-methyltransferase (adenine-specific)